MADWHLIGKLEHDEDADQKEESHNVKNVGKERWRQKVARVCVKKVTWKDQNQGTWNQTDKVYQRDHVNVSKYSKFK